MSKPLVKHVWRGRENRFTVMFEEVHLDRSTTPIDFDSVQSMVVRIGGYETTIATGSGDPTVNWYDPILNEGEIRFELGTWAETAGIPEAVYPLEMIAVEAAHPGGIVLLSEDTRLLMVSVHASVAHGVTTEGSAAAVDAPDVAIAI